MMMSLPCSLLQVAVPSVHPGLLLSAAAEEPLLTGYCCCPCPGCDVLFWAIRSSSVLPAYFAAAVRALQAAAVHCLSEIRAYSCSCCPPSLPSAAVDRTDSILQCSMTAQKNIGKSVPRKKLTRISHRRNPRLCLTSCVFIPHLCSILKHCWYFYIVPCLSKKATTVCVCVCVCVCVAVN